LSSRGLKAAELFAGIGGFRLACDSLGIETIWANDWDPKAARVYVHRFGQDSFFEGDIRGLHKCVPKHDLLTAGFPCQPFSSAGKKQGIRDPRGTLFQVIVDVIQRCAPENFILENVKRLLTMESGQHFATILDSLSSLGYLLEWRILNALDFDLPQNRERVVIIGSKNGHRPLSFLLTTEDSSCLDSRVACRLSDPDSWHRITDHGKFFKRWGMAMNGRFICAEVTGFSESIRKRKLKDIIQNEVDDSFDLTDDTLERIPKSNRVDKFVNGVEIIYNQSGGARMGYTIFGISGIAPTLTSSTSRHYERYIIDSRYRRLTNIEYARLQGFPDDHCEGISVSDQYVLYGNAVAPPLARWVVDRLIMGRSAAIRSADFQRELF
jgi:DNA (cytosine-5)-methyltransferase 1